MWSLQAAGVVQGASDEGLSTLSRESIWDKGFPENEVSPVHSSDSIWIWNEDSSENEKKSVPLLSYKSSLLYISMISLARIDSVPTWHVRLWIPCAVHSRIGTNKIFPQSYCMNAQKFVISVHLVFDVSLLSLRRALLCLYILFVLCSAWSLFLVFDVLRLVPLSCL